MRECETNYQISADIENPVSTWGGGGNKVFSIYFYLKTTLFKEKEMLVLIIINQVWELPRQKGEQVRGLIHRQTVIHNEVTYHGIGRPQIMLQHSTMTNGFH